MRLLIILCSSALLLCAECGLLKSVLGTVSNEVHKIRDGNVVENVVNIVRNETKGIVEDLGDLLHIRKNQNDKKIKPTVTDNDKKVEEIPNSTRKSVTIQDSTATIDMDEHIPVNNNQGDKLNPATEETVNEIPDNTNQAVDYIQTSSESSNTNKLVFKDEDYNYGEGTIVPRTARHIKADNKTKQNAEFEQTIENDDTKNSSVVEEIIYANMNVTELFFNNDDFNDIIIDFSDAMPPGNGSVENIVVGDCPEGSVLSADGSCVETTAETRAPSEAKNRANFVGGCLHGFGEADDGTCQEIIYD